MALKRVIEVFKQILKKMYSVDTKRVELIFWPWYPHAVAFGVNAEWWSGTNGYLRIAVYRTLLIFIWRGRDDYGHLNEMCEENKDGEA